MGSTRRSEPFLKTASAGCGCICTANGIFIYTSKLWALSAGPTVGAAAAAVDNGGALLEAPWFKMLMTNASATDLIFGQMLRWAAARRQSDQSRALTTN